MWGVFVCVCFFFFLSFFLLLSDASQVCDSVCFKSINILALKCLLFEFKGHPF